MGTERAIDDDRTLMALHDAGKSTRQIETILGTIDHSTIARRLKHLTPRKTTEIYKSLRADILAETQRQILMRSNKVSPKELRDLMTAFGILYDKEERERGHGDNKSQPLVMVIRAGAGSTIAVKVDNNQALDHTAIPQDRHDKSPMMADMIPVVGKNSEV